MTELERLLAAATTLDDAEVKADPTVDELLARNAELEAMVLASQDDQDVADYEAGGGEDGAKLALPAAAGSGLEPGDDGTDDLAAPGAPDYDDYDEDDLEADGLDGDVGDVALASPTQAKAAGWAPCPECGRGEADEYVDGTARCEHDGTPLVRLEAKGYDFGEDGGPVAGGDFDEDGEVKALELVESTVEEWEVVDFGDLATATPGGAADGEPGVVPVLDLAAERARVLGQ